MGKQIIIYKHGTSNSTSTDSQEVVQVPAYEHLPSVRSWSCIPMTRHDQLDHEIELLCPHCEEGFAEHQDLVSHVAKMHPITIGVNNCDLSQVDRKPAYLANMESIKSSQNKQLVSPQVSQIRNFPITSSKSENYVSTTTKSEGSKEARFQCGYCDKSFATPSKVKRHILTHTGEKPFVCQFCQRGFSQKVHMMEHISKHHADESLKAQQEAAAAAAAQAAVAQAAAPAPLIKSIASHANSSNKSPVYATHTIAASSMGGQVIQSSQGSPIRLSNTITATQVMADSTAVQIPIPENSYIVAEFSLKAEPHISSQIEQVTKVEPPDEDDLLPNKATEIMATLPLSTHNSLNYPSLPRSPVSPSFLIQQASGHTAGASPPSYQLSSPSISPATCIVSQSSERPFVCPHCSADFIRQSNLSVHMMKVHGETVEVRTHQCSYCDKKFKYPNKRRLHEMTHTGEKPNVCQFCTMGFFKKSRLRVHLTKHHGIPEEEVNNPNSTYLQNPSSQNTSSPITGGTITTVSNTNTMTTTQALIQKTIAQIQNGNGSAGGDGDHFCQYCQKPFSDKADLLAHERQEAMEFEQLHEMFEDTEFTGLGVGGGSHTDIIQNALLTAGIENGLGSPSVTDSDSVVTISEADIDSFSIGFIPDANWSNEVVSTSLPPISSTSSDPFYPAPQPLDLNIKTTISDHTQTSETGGQDLGSIQGTIYTTSETFQNIKTEIPCTTLPNLTGDVVNQMWETTVSLASPDSIKTEPMLTTANGSEIFTTVTSGSLNGIYTETFTLPASCTGQDSLSTNIISLGGSQQPHIINGNDLDFSKLAGTNTTQTNFSVTTQQQPSFLDPDQGVGLQSNTFLPGLGTQVASSTSRTINMGPSVVWLDDPTLPAGWKTRQHSREGQGNKVDTYYMAPDGTQFRSKWKVVEFMEAAGTYCQEEIDWVKNGITTPRPEVVTVVAVQSSSPKERSDKLKREWKEDDPTVPVGWKVAWTTTSDNRSKIAFMSPDKKIFHSRKAALQHMMAEGTYDPEDIVKMTKGLNVLLNVGDEWKEGDKSLPEGWKIRSHQWWCQKRNSHRIHYEFLSPLNEFFKSRKAVVEHMTQSGAYTLDQIELVRNATTIVQTAKAGTKKATGVNNNNSADRIVTIPSGPTRADLSPCNPLIGWKTGNSSLPSSWKIKRHEYANQTVYFYMSPKGEIIKSRRAVMDYMFEDGGYLEKDFNIVISGAKQRKVALQELYDARTNKKKKKRRRHESGLGREEADLLDEVIHESEAGDSELDLVDEDDDAKKCHKKQRVEKEPVLPTRRSGRIRIKEQLKELDDSDDSGDSDSEIMSSQGTNKRRLSSSDIQDPAVDPRRKRGRPPKSHLLEDEDGMFVGDEMDPITDTLLKVEKMGNSIIKMEGPFFRGLSGDTKMKEDLDIEYTEIDNYSENANEIKLEENYRTEKGLELDPNRPNSIHDNENAEERMSGFLVTSAGYTIANNYVMEQIYSTAHSEAGLVSIENSADSTANSAYAVVVNVLNDIVSSISE